MSVEPTEATGGRLQLNLVPGETLVLDTRGFVLGEITYRGKTGRRATVNLKLDADVRVTRRGRPE